MPHESQPLQPFNLDTMSGVYPGTRTPVYQRLRLRLLDGSEVAWFHLLWYRDPPGAWLFARAGGAAAPPLLHLPDLLGNPDLAQEVKRAVAGAGWQLRTCGTCVHWQATSLLSDDGLSLGRCGWRAAADAPLNGDDELPDALGIQSCLALDCAHFADSGTTAGTEELRKTVPSSPERPRVPKSAELDTDRLPFWSRQWRRVRTKLGRTLQPDQEQSHPIIERSGVGAGTESCFACQGRMANLGALAVESPEGDKQTLSVWRCRLCHTTYLNDWIDRWERLDSLETEERYYRIAPAEALAALRLIRSVAGGEHPVGRQARHSIRTRLLALVADQEPISHQIRQGR